MNLTGRKHLKSKISVRKFPFLEISPTACSQISYVMKQLTVMIGIQTMLKNLIKKKGGKVFFTSYVTSDKDTNKLETINYLECSLNSSIYNTKTQYYSKLSTKLSNPITSLKAYWSILKKFFKR